MAKIWSEEDNIYFAIYSLGLVWRRSPPLYFLLSHRCSYLHIFHFLFRIYVSLDLLLALYFSCSHNDQLCKAITPQNISYHPAHIFSNGAPYIPLFSTRLNTSSLATVYPTLHTYAFKKHLLILRLYYRLLAAFYRQMFSILLFTWRLPRLPYFIILLNSTFVLSVGIFFSWSDPPPFPMFYAFLKWKLL